MEFFLHNEEGIPFPPIRPAYRPGKRYFERFCCLVPRDSSSSILGEGGAGAVHLARDEVLDRLVALKLLSPELQRDPMARLDVIRESRQAMELTHPNIVRIHDFHESEDGWGISMQFIDGHDLDKWRVENSSGTSSIIPYPVERIAEWVRQLCDALSYAHNDALMVHRDIKPRNLMIERQASGHEKLYLTDFGITKRLATHTLMISKIQPAGKDDKTALGTLPYMSWQQLQNERPNTSDDIYSVGATIYDLVTGRPPFYEGSYDEISHQIEKVIPPSMAERLESFALTNAGIPDEWEEVVRACLEKDPEKRPQSLQEVSDRLGLSKSAAVEIASPEPAAPDPKIEERLNDLSADLSATKALLTDNEAALAEKEALLVEKEAALNEAQSALAGIETSLAGSETSLSEKDEAISSLQAEVKKLQDAIASGDSAGETLREELTTLAAEKDQALADLQSEIESLKNDLAEKESNGLSLTTQLATLTTQLATSQGEAQQLQSQLVQTRETAKLDENSAISALQDSLDQRETELTELRQTLGAREESLTSLQATSEARQKELEDETARLQLAIEEAQSNSQAEIARLEATLEKTRADADAAQQEEVARLQGELEKARTDSEATRQAEVAALQHSLEQTKAAFQSEISGLQKSLDDTKAQAQVEANQHALNLEELRKSSQAEAAQAVAVVEEQLQRKESEIDELRRESSNLQKEFEDLLANSKAEQARLAGLEKQLSSAQAEQNKTNKELKIAHETAQKAEAEKESQVAKARQHADRIDARYEEIKDRQSAPLGPLLMTLIGALVLGLGGGAILGKFLPGDDDKKAATEISFDSHESEIPSSKGPASELITAGLFRKFTGSLGISDDDLAKQVPGINDLSDNDPVSGVDYLFADRFTTWLTAKDPFGSIADGKNLYYRLPTKEEVPGDAGMTPEWTISAPDEEIAGARAIVVKDEKDGQWLIKTWTETLKGKPIGFRVVLTSAPTS